MLVRSYSKNNNLVAEEVISILKQQDPSRQWLGSSKLSSHEIHSLNNHFNVGNRLPSLPNATEAEQPPVEDMRSPIEDQDSQPPAGQIQPSSQQLPQAQQSQSEMAQSIQYLLTQQQAPSYSSELAIEAAALDGSNDAYREFISYQANKASTRQGLEQLAQTLEELRYKASTDAFGQTQKDFLSHLQVNSEKLQAAKSQKQQQVESAKKQASGNINLMQNAVEQAMQNLKTGS